VSAVEFKSTLQMLVPMVVESISRVVGLSEDELIPRFYASKVYSDLEREETKLWHLSPLALAELYKEELQSGSVSYPEEA